MFSEEDEVRWDNTNIPEVEKLFVAHNIPYVERDGLLRCELKVFDVLYGVVCVVSAENLIRAKDVDIALRRMQYRIFEEELEMQSKPALYLFVVWDGKTDHDAKYLEARWKIEQNMGAARKLVMQPAEVITWLQNPFPAREMGDRANAVPMLTALRPIEHPSQKAPPAAKMFSREDVLASVTADCNDPSFHKLQPLVAHLYRRIMGSAQKVFWTEDGPKLGQVYDARGLPLDWCSRGEQTIFALSIFLAKAGHDMTPNLCLGFPCTFDGIDELRQIAAFDCLRDLVAATGVSIVLQAPQNDRRFRVILRVRPVIEALGGEVADRGFNFAV